ncbi:hypothetical protein ALI22I_20380 [Saccharothrix sp. ALI-22-I]|uniref:hypothetical protein n=1 Tax=Saccharothrix sp. ALI-22-I TaxID=1933778 RepID=UPI00097BCA9C|nr:hypothetical protein [Saccharothrix sp. ALI-22-I]ONI88098.1 hypothetical protein ALI22I_20380 [Saccharothrix sp. ALI-22-I]
MTRNTPEPPGSHSMPQATDGDITTDRVLAALRSVVDYLVKPEAADYIEQDDDGRQHHILHDLAVLSRFGDAVEQGRVSVSAAPRRPGEDATRTSVV